MPFSDELFALLNECGHMPQGSIVAERVDRLAGMSPLYRNFLRRHPEYLIWLEAPENRDENFRFSAFQHIWQEEFEEGLASKDAFVRALQLFRRKMSLRIAYREVNELADVRDSLGELTLLAEFCLGTVTRFATGLWEKRLGQPWDERLEQPARFCILGLGKLGGRELNFCSDLDLIYFYEGSGHCRKNGRTGRVTNEEFFARLCRDISSMMEMRTENGFLYNIDLRLRPEGSTGPIARPLTSLENYYYAAGQTWERLAMARARCVAGDSALGGEFFESIHTFRYPRHPPPGLLEEIADVKIRMEKEVLGATNLERDIKNGFGGIREIEFFVQALQMLNAGSNPFLQESSTFETLEQLARYDLLGREDYYFLVRAYSFLRKVENRLQMREEKQTHALPEAGPGRDALARSLGYEEAAEFERELEATRRHIHEIYVSLFGTRSEEDLSLEWTLYLSGKRAGESIEGKLKNWFGEHDRKDLQRQLQIFALGGPQNLLTKEMVTLFVSMAEQFDAILPELAFPLPTLGRVSRFAESYGARKQFFKTCSDNPHFFRALCLLFDRSRFTCDLLTRHPEIIEEVLLVPYKREKETEETLEEMERLPQDKDLPKWLWLYVKAEQVRYAITELLGDAELEELEGNLTQLTDAAIRFALKKIDPEGELAVVALGKYGGRELTLGSDLDIMLLGTKERSDTRLNKWLELKKLIGHRHPLGRTFEIDLRLRPHGQDGPVITTLPALKKYHQKEAQVWEKQLLTRARVVAGNEQMSADFVGFQHALLFEEPITKGEIKDVLAMRRRIAKEKGSLKPPERAFKAGWGGLIDFEFLCQVMQLAHGFENEALQSPGTRPVLGALREMRIMDEAIFSQLEGNYNFLRKLELYLRRDVNTGVDALPASPEEQSAAAKWLGYGSRKAFWEEHRKRMHFNDKTIKDFINDSFDLN